MSQLEVISSKAASVPTPSEAWATMWSSSNWGELLQSAPISISLLGSEMILASKTKDFNLMTAPNSAQPFEWKQIKFPDSFKASAMQLVNDSYTAFETVHENMTIIRDLSRRMPEVISALAQCLASASGAPLIDALQNLNNVYRRCDQAAKSCESAFRNLIDLTGELTIGCTVEAAHDEHANAVRQAISISSMLRSEFLKLRELFAIVSNFSGVMGDTVQFFAAPVDMILGGVGLSAFTKNMTSQQIMKLVKIAMQFAEIAGLYAEVSNEFVLPVHRKLGEMLAFPGPLPGNNEAARAAYVKHLEVKHAQLDESVKAQSAAFARKFAADQNSFELTLSPRIADILNAVWKGPSQANVTHTTQVQHEAVEDLM